MMLCLNIVLAVALSGIYRNCGKQIHPKENKVWKSKSSTHMVNSAAATVANCEVPAAVATAIVVFEASTAVATLAAATSIPPAADAVIMSIHAAAGVQRADAAALHKIAPKILQQRGPCVASSSHTTSVLLAKAQIAQDVVQPNFWGIPQPELIPFSILESTALGKAVSIAVSAAHCTDQQRQKDTSSSGLSILVKANDLRAVEIATPETNAPNIVQKSTSSVLQGSHEPSVSLEIASQESMIDVSPAASTPSPIAASPEKEETITPLSLSAPPILESTTQLISSEAGVGGAGMGAVGGGEASWNWGGWGI